MKTSKNNIAINKFLIDTYSSVFLLADTKILLDAIDILCRAKGGKEVDCKEASAFIVDRKKYCIKAVKELETRGILFFGDDGKEYIFNKRQMEIYEEMMRDAFNVLQ